MKWNETLYDIGIWGPRRLRQPEILDTWYMKVLRLPVLYSFLLEAKFTPGLMCGWKDKALKNPNDHIGNRICIPLVHSGVLQPTGNPLRTKHYMFYLKSQLVSGVPRGVVWGRVQPPPPPEIPNALKNRAKLNPIWKLFKIAEFRMPTLQDVRKKSQ